MNASQSSKCPLIKFADYTALIGLISEDDDSVFLTQVDCFVNHCDDNYLELNVSKTKEMVIDFRQNRPDPQPVDIKGSAMARVDTYTYLGIVLNNKQSCHVDFIINKLNSRMYCLRKLNFFRIRSEIFLDFLRGTLEMVWSDNSHPLHGQLRSQLIPQGSGRLGVSYAGSNRHPASFTPKAIKLYNGNVGR